MGISHQKQTLYPNTGSPGPAHPVSTELVLAELEKIIANPNFNRCPRLSRFLRFTVEHTVQGQADGIKEYVVGVEVFQRGKSYDPHLDPIVRVQAGRLRSRLKQYYENDGLADLVIIEYPTGCYVPIFKKRQIPPPQKLHSPLRAWLSRNPITLAVVTILLLTGSAALWRAHSSRLPWLRLRRLETGGKTRTDGGQTESPAPLSSIVVLPFKDISPQKDQEYFCDGMTETLTNALAKVEGLHVAAPTSAFAFRANDLDIREIGKELRVGSALEGSILKAGKRLRISVRLVSVTDGLDIWSETYERQARDVFAMQDEISNAIVKAVRIQPLGATGSSRQLANRYTQNRRAYNFYLKGRYQWNKGTATGADLGMKSFEQAVAEDPNYALAYTGIADSYILLNATNALPPSEVMPKAEAAALRAIRIDNTLAEAHAALGFIKAVYYWDWVGAEREFNLAFRFNPGYSTAHQRYALTCLASTGRLDEALAEIRQAVDLDPASLKINGSSAEFVGEL